LPTYEQVRRARHLRERLDRAPDALACVLRSDDQEDARVLRNGVTRSNGLPMRGEARMEHGGSIAL
jgi:hypothetical protein